MLGAKRPLSTWLHATAALLMIAVSLAIAVVAPATPADAAVVRPFTTVFSQQTNGSIQITGNSVMTCGTATACTQALNGTTAASNNNFTMTYLDVDSDASTTRSSSANLTLPTGARVLYAGLFWGGARTAGTGGTASTGAVDQIKFRAPGAAGYTTLTADRVDNQTTNNLDYSAYRNVTSIVQGAGAGTYWGADIAAATGADRYGGWSLVVAVEDPNAPLRDLTVFNGYATVQNSEVVDTTISGFLAPPSGTVGAKFGTVTYEGDNGITGDYLQVGTTRLADGLSPSANFFTSRISAGGVNLTNRNPSSVNSLGLDAKVIDAPGVVPNGATSASVRFATSGDFYYPAALTTQIDLYAPTIQGSKSVTNLSGNSPAKVGDVLEYSMTFSNTGDDAAINSVLNDPIPANTTFVPGSIRVTAGANQGTKTDATGDDQGEYVAASRTVRVRVGTGANGTTGGRLAPAATTTVTFQVRVTTPNAGTTLTNTASLAYRAETIGRDYTYNTAEVSTPVADEADVSLTKTAAPDPVTAGNQITYTLAVGNSGPTPAAGVQVVDTLPTGATFVSANPSAGTCSFASPTLTCSLGTVANGGNATVTVTVRVPPDSDATSLTNVARVTTTTSDPNPNNNNAAATSSVVRQADISLTKTASPTNPVPGTDVTYTLVATNDGASRATAVTVTDTLPASLTIRSATSNRGTCTIAGSQLSCAAGTLDPGQSVTVTVVAGVPSNAPATALVNSARVTSSTPDPDASNNAASATVTPQAPRADIVVAKDTVTSPVVAGRPVQYAVTVTNNGPSDAANVTLNDPLPASLSGATATTTAGTCSITAGTLACSLGPIAAGRSARVTTDAQLAAGATGTLTNSATASSPTTDPTPGNNTGTTSAPITASADLGITKTVGAVVDGNPATYTLVVTNNGPSVARAVTVSDPVPSPLTYQSSTTSQGTCTPSGSPTTVTCALGDLAVGASATITVTAGTPGNGSGRGVSNTATVSSPTPDPVAANNSATSVLPTASQADLSLTKAVSPNPVVAGQTVTWTLTARNNGPSQASVVTITDTIPARVTGVNATTSTPGATCAASAGNNVSCTAPTLTNGSTLVVTVTGTVAPGSATGSLSNAASVAAQTPADPSSTNNTATATTDVVARADVSVVKDGPATAAAGSQAQWTMLVQNNGPSTASGIVLTDALPVGVTFVSSTSTPGGVSCTANGSGLVTCPVGALAAGGQVLVTITGLVDSGLPAGTALTNTGGVTATTPDPTPGNNTDTHATNVTEASDVSITKAADPATLVPGAESVYVLTVSSNGPSDARDVVVTDTLDPDLAILEATIAGGTCTIAGQLVTCRVALLPSGATARAEIRVLVDAQRQTPLANTAEVTSSTDTTPGGNNDDAVSSPVAPQADLSVIKTASDDEIAAGEGVTYTLTVVNNGPSSATASRVTDTLPTGIVPATATTTAGSCTVTGQDVDCALGTVAPGTPVVVTIVAGTSPGATTGTRTNTATASSTTPDDVPGNDSSSVDVAVVAEADVSITKVADSDSFVPGRQVSWNIVVNNLGPSTARGIVVTDTVPAGVTVTSAIHGQATPCTVSGQDVTCDLGDRVPGQRVITITGTLASAYTGNTLVNTARATTTSPDPTPGNNQATSTTGIVRLTELEVVKTVSPANPVAGQRVTYTFSAYNNGPSDAANPQFIDQLPSGLTDVVVNRPTLLGTPATAECELRPPVNPGTADNPAAPTVFCSGPTFRAGLPARVIGSVEATIAPGFTGTLTNTARISSDTIDLVASNNESSVSSVITAGADVSITKTVSPATPVPGQNVTWTVTVRNDGPSTARNVVVRDDVNDAITGLTAGTGTTPSPCSIATGNDVTCTIGDMAPGAVTTITMTGGVPPGFTGALDNTATVSSPTDTTPGNNTATATSTPQARADVSIAKTVSPETPVPGQDVTWTVTVTNTGPSTARNVVVRDDVADAVTGLAATPSTGTCTTAAVNDVTCALGDVAPGAIVTITLTGSLPAGFTGALDNTATVSSPTDTDPSNNTATATSTPQARADVSVTKAVDPQRPVPGGTVTYTVIVANNGPSTARTVTMRDDVPDALTGLTATPTSGTCTIGAGNLVDCSFGAMAPTDSVTITIAGGLPAGFTGDLVNTATIASPTDTTPGNNSATASGTTDPQADVSITKTLTPAAPVPGQDVTYTLVVTNNGPSVARAVTLEDDLADVLTDVTATTGQSSDPCRVDPGNDVSCAWDELPASGAGSSVVVTITGSLPADFTGTLNNTAVVDSVTDSTPGNNSATANGAAAPRADVSITKALSPTSPVPGQDVTYTLAVTNNGPSVARNVVVHDDVADQLTGLTATAPCAIAANNDVTCNLGDVAPGATTTLTLRGGLPAGFTGSLDNTATVASPTDTTPGNNSASANGTADPTANVSISKVLTPSSPIPGRDVSWTVVVSNNGPSVARNVVVRDDVVDQVTGLTATAPCTIAADNDVTCLLGDLAPGSTATLTLTGGLPAGFTGDLVNTATVASPTDTTPGNNSATVTGTAAPNANVGITKTVSPSNPVPGNDVTWTVVVSNTGPSVARDVVVRDNVNDAITGLTATAPCTIEAGNDVTCTLGDLAPGDQVVITLAGSVPPGFTGELSNTATVSSPTDTTPGNNSATANPATAPGADLSIIKTASPTVPVPGQDITWTVTVTNAGPSVARDVVITDDVNDALVGVTASAPCLVAAGNEVTCAVGDLGTGGTDASVTVTITGRVPPSYTGPLGNTASVSSSTPDANLDDNTSSTGGTAAPQADVSITKTASPTNPVPGTDQTWTLTVTNAGPSVATDVIVRDDVDDAITGLTATSPASPNLCAVEAANDVTCTIGTMAVGETVTITLTGGVPNGFTGALDNTATVSSPIDDTPGNNTSTTNGTAAPQADVSIAKTATPANPVPGQTASWTLVVSNAGPSVARNVRVTDDVLDAITDLSATAPCQVGGANLVTCDLGDLAPGASRTLTLSGGLPASYTGAVDNTATVSSPTDSTPGNNTSTTNGTAAPQAEVSITKTASPTVPVPGQDVSWTITVANAGPSVARNVVVRDDVLDAITGLTATSPCTIAAGNVVTCNLGDLGPGTPRSVVLTGRLPADYEGTVSNTATVTSPTDTSSGNNSSSTSGTAAPRADVSITKTATPTDPVPGQDATWTLVVSNTGPSLAQDVVVSDDVIDALTGVTAVADSDPDACAAATGNVVTCNLGDLGPNGTVVITIRGAVPPTFSGPVSNTATVSSSTPDPDAANNSSTTNGTAAAQADVSVTKTLEPARPVPGQAVTWTVTVANAGPSTARTVEVSDDVDDAVSGLVVTSTTTTDTCEVGTGNQVSCDLGDVAAGATRVLTLRGTLAPDFTGTLANTAQVASPTDTTPANNAARVAAEVAPRANLSITKTMTPTKPVAGRSVSFTMVVSNAGPSTSRQVVVSDELIEPLSDASASVTGNGTCTVTGRTITCTAASLAPGAQLVVTVQAAVDAAYTGEVTNVATVSAATPDPDASNNTARVGETGTGSCAPAGRNAKVVVCPDLDVDKTASPTKAAPGDTVTYTIRVTNAGPSAASDVRVVDGLDDDLTLVSVRIVEGEGRVSTNDRRFAATFSVLRPGARGVVRLVTRVADDASGRLPNVAVATAKGDDGQVEVQDTATIHVLDDQGSDPGNDPSTDPSTGGDPDDGQLPDTGLPASVVPLAALSLLLLAVGLYLIRRSRISGGRSPGQRG